MVYHRKDTWYRKAKAEGYRSRSAYKLQELDRQFKLFRRGQRVLDLGCAPGGWLQVATQAVSEQGRVIGIDRLAVAPLDLPNVFVVTGDIRAPESLARLNEMLGGLADVVLSDMAPDTSGVGFADHARSIELVRAALDVARALLRPGGTLVAKVFEGPDLNPLVAEMRTFFGDIRRVRLDTTRKGSRELYLIARPRLRSSDVVVSEK
jgi:23S rRNA (uridine2552-2'-O)-methyltransferase